jgi:hypothetical protein
MGILQEGSRSEPIDKGYANPGCMQAVARPRLVTKKPLPVGITYHNKAIVVCMLH